MADQDDTYESPKSTELLIELPALTEVSEGVDFTSASGIGELFSESSLATMMSKVSVLETFLKSTTKDCKFSDFLRELLLAIMQVIKSEAGSIFELDAETNSLFFRAVVGSRSDRIVNFIIPMGQGIVGHVAESKLPISVENVPENSVHLKSIERAVGFETRNIVAFPILIRGQLFGVLELLNRVGESNYTPEDQELLKYLCTMCSKFIEIRLMIAWSLEEKDAAKKKTA